jgi:hypothetical protein
MDIDPRRALSQREFCWIEHLSIATYFELKKAGLGPDETVIGRLIRISPEAREAWRQRMAAHSRSQAAQLEAERRRQSAVLAGKASAASALHVSKRRQKPPRHGRAGRFAR